MPTVPQPPQAVRTEKSLSRFRKSRGSFFASGYTSLDGLFRLCRMVIKQARKRDLLTQLLQDGGAGKFKAIAEAHGRAGTSEKVSPAALAGTGKPTASAWDKSVTFFFISAASCAFASLASGPLGGGCPLLALPQEAKNAVRGMYIPTQHISLQHSR